MTVESKPSNSSTKEKTLHKELLYTPVIYLIDPPATWKTHPWDIDLLGILQEFQDRITLADQVNLSQAGRVISVASHLHRKRAEYVLQEEKKRTHKKKRTPRKPAKETGEVTLPQISRPRSRRISTLDLLNALSHAIQIVKRRSTKSPKTHPNRLNEVEEDILAILPEELVRELDLGSEGIEHFIDQVYTMILYQTKQNEDTSIGFFALVQQMLAEEQGITNLVYKEARDRLTRLYIVRILLSVLYLILRNKITVNQTEFFADLQIQPLTSHTLEES